MKASPLLPIGLFVAFLGLGNGELLWGQWSLPTLGDVQEALSASGSFSIVPWDTWGSGDWDALMDEFFGYTTPRTSQMYVRMDTTATTTYEGDLFIKKLGLRLGINVDVDSNFVGKLYRFMGYIGFKGFTLRYQQSRLKGTAVWTGNPVSGMPPEYAFDNPLINVDLLYYFDKGIDYLGLGYSSYRLPVQLNILTYNETLDSVWWAPQSATYQPDMDFHIYSLLLGLDTLQQVFFKRGILAGFEGFAIWLATQDRFGLGLSYISDEAAAWVSAANGGAQLWSATQIAMLVDYNLIVGGQWVGNLGPIRAGLGLGFQIGGQTVTCITPRGPVDSSAYVDASPSVYLYHYGPILKVMVSW